MSNALDRRHSEVSLAHLLLSVGNLVGQRFAPVLDLDPHCRVRRRSHLARAVVSSSAQSCLSLVVVASTSKASRSFSPSGVRDSIDSDGVGVCGANQESQQTRSKSRKSGIKSVQQSGEEGNRGKRAVRRRPRTRRIFQHAARISRSIASVRQSRTGTRYGARESYRYTLSRRDSWGERRKIPDS